VYRDYTERSLFTEVGISVTDITIAVYMEPVAGAEEPAVVFGDFTEAEVSDHLTANGYEQSNSDLGEYSVYRGPGTIAVTDGGLLYSSDGRDHAEAIHGAQTGEQPRYTETNDTMQTLLGEIDNGTFVYGVAHDATPQSDHNPANGTFAGMLGTAYADVVSGETTTATIVYLFESADDVDSDAIDTYTSGDLFDAYRSVSSTQDDRKVTITGEVATGDLYDETI
jgi:hypothetical protein